jgi:hypothetical protein
MTIGFTQALQSAFCGNNWKNDGIEFMPATREWGIVILIFTASYSFVWRIYYDDFVLNDPQQYRFQRASISEHVRQYLNPLWC